jgi:hypothetical protein
MEDVHVCLLEAESAAADAAEGSRCVGYSLRYGLLSINTSACWNASRKKKKRGYMVCSSG